jgi:hypothetical protein
MRYHIFLLLAGLISAVPNLLPDQALGATALCPDLMRRFISSVPATVEAGVAHVHSYRLNPGDGGMVVSVLVPSPKGIPGAVIADLSTQSASRPWPPRFVISDGYPGGEFLYADLSPGSPLKLELQRILKNLKNKGLDPDKNREAFLEHLRDHAAKFFRSTDERSLSQVAQGAIRKPPGFTMGATASREFSDFSGKGIGPAVFDLGQEKAVTPLEYHFTREACGMCIHKALLTSLILQEAGIPHRFRTGFASHSGPSYRNTGHSLLELSDGRILDPTWNFLKPKKQHPQHPDWIEGAGWWWTENAHFPFLVLQ